MSKTSLILLAAFCLLLATAPPALAQTFSDQADSFNPATNFSTDANFLSELIGGNASSPGLLVLTIVFGGFALLIMLISGGFQMLTNPTDPQAQEAGKKRITWAIAGFFILFASYWLTQIIQIIFNLNIT